MKSTLILTAVLVYVAAAFARPALRVWRRQGVWPIVFAREPAPAQRLLGWFLRAVLVAIAGTGVARLTIGPGSLAVWSTSRGVHVIGWLLLGGGALLTEVAQRQMGDSWRAGIDDRPTALVTGGIFRLVRNPIFSGFLLFLAGYACLMPAWWSLGLWVATALGLRIQIAYEEQHLVRFHGQTYLTYAARVGRLVPLFGRLREPLPSIQNHGRS